MKKQRPHLPANVDAMGAVLRRGVTGFDAASGPSPSAASFKAACYAALRAAPGARIAAIEGPNPGRNHHRARVVVDAPGLPPCLWILLNEACPLIAFARVRREDEIVYAFIDAPALAERFYGAYEIVAAELLEASFDWAECERRGLLGPEELRQASDWSPARVGDVVFNYWD